MVAKLFVVFAFGLGLLVDSSSLAGQQSLRVARADADADALVVTAFREFQRTGVARSIQQGTFLLFPFGQGQPKLTCAPLRACIVKLEAGEKYLDPFPGDDVRWLIEDGRGPQGSTVLSIKPTECNITTNLAITTDRRIYHLLLDSPPCDKAEDKQNPDLPYVRQVAYWYPHEMARQAASSMQDSVVREEKEAQRVIPVAPSVTDPTAMYFSYRWQRDRGYPWTPEQVFDDGVRTYIRLPTRARQYEAPVLFELGPGGEMQILNYDMRGDYYVLDRILERGVLVLGGGGKSEQRLLIVRDRRKGA